MAFAAAMLKNALKCFLTLLARALAFIPLISEA